MTRLRLCLPLAALLLAFGAALRAADRFVAFDGGDLCLTPSDGAPIAIYADPADQKGVGLAVGALTEDFGLVTGRRARVVATPAEARIVVGTLGHSAAIDRLAKQKRLDAGALRGKREMFLITVVDSQLVIAGSDRRGTIYGIYELSRQMGVSPWYWWADAPVAHRDRIYALRGTYTDGEPAVRYRGIFLNDEAPCLTSWVKNTYGTGYGDHRFYARVYELLLRLKGNLLWPAMWGWAFYADDPENSRLADEMGIVVGTSHHEPMARNHQEYARRRKDWGAWNYATNKAGLDRFFREGIERMKGTEDLVTIGMRGDGDEAMSAEADTRLLREIIDSQRRIIADVTGRKASETPQVWALYKEVLDYYDAGLRAPDDVIMLLCDDNWGTVRRLPTAAERQRTERERRKPLAQRRGGWGMYYHVDYVGAPRNSKWLCMLPIQNMWEQMTTCYDYGVDALWILNVGDLKPMEYPITLFLDMAWQPHRYGAADLLDHTRRFFAETLGADAEADAAPEASVAAEAARILNLALKYNGRVTAEMLDARTYDLASGEWEHAVAQYRRLALDARDLADRIPAPARDAYRQLLLHPVEAMANLYELYYAQAMNLALHAAGDPQCNEWADRCERAFRRDAELSRIYNKEMSGGKWDGMMVQKHIGYTSWNDDFGPTDRLPELRRLPDAEADAPTVGYTFTPSPGGGVVSIEAQHVYALTEPASAAARWTVLPLMGRTLSGLAVRPYIEPADGASLTYRFDLAGAAALPADSLAVEVTVKSNLAFARPEGHRYAVSLDGGEEREVNFNATLLDVQPYMYSVFYPTVARRVVKTTLRLPYDGSAGLHTLTLRPLDPGVVFEKIVIDLGGKRTTYLGEPESPHRRAAQ